MFTHSKITFGLVLTENIESVTVVIKEILEANFIIYLAVRSLLTQEEVCYYYLIFKIYKLHSFLRKRKR